ncbi:MAG: ribosome assembly cofactor RimP [Bacteroidetes bacterium]|uniref:Ribosome maturation factor RimP n=1 Tax=Phaeocystidibacter marisrubri TaxID=1577780 RepID=A0A6L3ZCW6_9FLAO|nr:ribosome assembly cofactor RimP [Phaeocystidibacter marisrubri]KAB2815169.1 ribosome assembly cofactor RimP [Phaeocystidibacter marisrubri]TNE27413.1 MAG: ribosome assembly cofactor RimP [Bacteroidota bacterium]GGH70692.1 ribosome maturation factor RimP [Phaeocystidibacter marisrubri]
MTEEQVRPIVEEALEERGAFLVELHVSAGGNIMVYADKEGGIGLGDLKMISRKIEGDLDRDSQDFSLEVSSPGMFNPFKVHRQYVKNVGKSVSVRTTDGATHEGLMVEVTEAGITLETQKRVAKEVGKGKKTVTERFDLTFDQIAETKLEFKF